MQEQTNKVNPQVSQDSIQSAVDIAVSMTKLSADIKYLVKGVDVLNEKMDGLPNNYASTKDFSELKIIYYEGHKDVVNQVEIIRRYLYLGLGGLSVITFAFKFFVK